MIDRQEQMFHCSRVLFCLATLLLFRLSEAQSCNAATQNCDVCRTLCNGVSNQINVFQNSSVPRLTCTPSQVGGALDTVRWYHRTSSDDVQGTLIVKDGSRYGGDALETLSINNVVPGDEGLYRCEYTLTGGTQGQDDDVGCVLVQGRAAFTSCNSQTCSEVITINTGQNITFDTRIMFSNSGPCGIPQGTDSLQLYRGTPPSQSNLLYVCGNANNNPCPETYMTSTIRAVSSGSHKFNLSLTIPNAAVEDGVTYTARVEVLRPSGGRATLEKTFHVTVNIPPPTTPPSQPTTPSDAPVRTVLMRVPADVALNDTNECNITNGGCEQVCTNILGGFFCSCRTGYQQDGSNCTDINECTTSNGDCEHNCTNTDGGFICSCHTGYQLDGNGLNCNDVDECANDDLNNCHEDANCTNTGGSFNCTCNNGYSGNGTECTDIDECETGSENCDEKAQCTNTEGSFTCSCNSGYTGDGTECSVVLTVGLLLTVALVLIAVVLMIIAILCGSICVVRKLRKMDAKRSKIKLHFSDDVVDLTYSPVSPFSTSKLKRVASIISVFDMLDIPDRQLQTSNKDSDGTLDTASTLDTVSTLDTESTLDTDGISDVLNTLLHHNSITTTVTPNVHMSICLETGTNASLSPSSITKDFDLIIENVSCKAEVNSNGNDPLDYTAYSEDDHASTSASTSKHNVHPAKEMQSSSVCVSDIVVSDVHEASHTSAVETITGHSTGACNSAGQNGGYVHSSHESPDLNWHTVNSELESEFLQSTCLEVAEEVTDLQPHSVLLEASKDEGHLAKEPQSSSGYVADTVACAASQSSAVEPFAGDSNDTAVYHSGEQNDEYVRSEYLLQGSHGSPDMNSHIIELEPEFLQSVYLEEAVDQQSHSVNDMVEASKELQFSSSYLSDTHFLASVLEKPNVFELQGLEDSSNHSVVKDDLSIGKMSPQLFSEDYRATSDSTFGYFDNTTHSVSQVQHLSVNRGYITDCSKSGEYIPHTMQQIN